LLIENSERRRQYEQALTDTRNQIMHEIGQQLITAPDLTGLVEVLADELTKVGIPGCYLALYESALQDTSDPIATQPPAPSKNPPKVQARGNARLLLTYEDGQRTELAANSTVFPATQLVPAARLSRETPCSMVAAPLYFNDQQLGFVLFEVGTRMG